jgi:hypothetical protein
MMKNESEISTNDVYVDIDKKLKINEDNISSLM